MSAGWQVRRGILTGMVGCLVFATLPAGAEGDAGGIATVSTDRLLPTAPPPGLASYKAEDSASNDLVVSLSPDGHTITFTDPGVTIVADASDCTGGVGSATCTTEREGGFGSLFVNVGPGDDQVDVGSGAGLEDSLTGGTGNDVLTGGAGRTVVRGDEGNDLLRGGAGPDFLTGGPGADDVVGGPDVDAAGYIEKTESVAVSLDDLADDGTTGEGDNVHSDVEDVQAFRPMPDRPPIDPPGGDTLIGSDGSNLLQTTNGPAVLKGLGGADRLELIDATSGSVAGGSGADQIVTFGGPAKVDGNSGDDRITTVDGPGTDIDTVRCGAGTDTAIVDARDSVQPTCETVERH